MLKDQEYHSAVYLAIQKYLSGDFIPDAEEDYAKLVEILQYVSYRYYAEDDPLISDGEYDQLYKVLVRMEELHPEWLVPDSPSQRVGADLQGKFPTVRHLVPMLSLENAFGEEELLDWDKRCRNLAGRSELEYCVEPKYDGASISLVYQKGYLVRAATRGDGIQGEEITLNAKQIRNIPLSLPLKSAIEEIEIRGEVVIPKKTFEQLNLQRAEEGLSLLANPRNAASGTLRMLSSREVASRKLFAIFYHISEIRTTEGTNYLPEINDHYSALRWLQSQGFSTPSSLSRIFPSIQAVIGYCKEFAAQRDSLPYEIDGLVIKLNNYELQEQLGMTSHHPRWAMAYKFAARQGTSILRAVEFQVGRTGSVTPVAKIDPVSISGVTISSISLFNEDVIREKNLMIGDQVLVERAGDVIPYIVKSFPELRKGEETHIVFPENCPVCGHSLIRPQGEAVHRCPSVICPAQQLERLVHFCSKQAMDIRGMGEANIRKFYQNGWLPDIPAIYKMNWSLLQGMEGFGDRSVENLKTAVEDSKAQPLYRVLFGLGVRHVGITMAKQLTNNITDLRTLKSYSVEELMQMPDVGPKLAQSVFEFFSDPENLALLDELESLGVKIKQEDQQTADDTLKLSGKSFLFTGTMNLLKRSDAEALVMENGGTVAGSVNNKLTYLVAGEKAGSKLEKARKISTVKILTEAQFLALIHPEGETTGF